MPIADQQTSEFWCAVAREHQEARELAQVLIDAGCSMAECRAAFSDGKVVN